MIHQLVAAVGVDRETTPPAVGGDAVRHVPAPEELVDRRAEDRPVGRVRAGPRDDDAVDGAAARAGLGGIANARALGVWTGGIVALNES